jgi:hypothetical protein
MDTRQAPRVRPVDIGEDHLHLLTLCLELQLDLLLVALRPDPPTGRLAEGGTDAGWPRWDGDTLDLTGAEPDAGPAAPSGRPSQGEGSWLEARLAATIDAIDEMLAHPEVRRHPAVGARLERARRTCTERMAALPGPPAVASSSVAGPDVEAGHFLG